MYWPRETYKTCKVLQGEVRVRIWGRVSVKVSDCPVGPVLCVFTTLIKIGYSGLGILSWDGPMFSLDQLLLCGSCFLYYRSHIKH